ncbi:MAG TPA: M2 family metallopeptidase [Myxococcales bacterium]|nr:M2 family metallopeptidase [Myxococcales bacterium]
MDPLAASMRRIPLPGCAVLAIVLAAGCEEKPPPSAGQQPSSATSPAQAEGRVPPEKEAHAFMVKVEGDLRRLWSRASTAEWIKNTYITDDTERNEAAAAEEVMGYLATAIKQSTRYKGLPGLDRDTERKIHLLQVASTLPAPSDPEKRAELAGIASKLNGIYGKGKWCGKEGSGGKCRDLEELSNVLADPKSSYDQLLDAWAGWHTTSRPMRPLYEREVALANEGAREIGYANVGELWRSGYDMPPDQFEKESDRLYEQVRPLYEQLHCYVRQKLQKKYGKERIPDGGLLPAHLTGNMWAQGWTNIYPLVEPFPGQASQDVTAALKQKGYDPVKMVKQGEAFFTSLGMDPLPPSFWERSMFIKPRDREVVCHASAWDVTFSNDLRIKMCIQVNEEDLITIHHELGHDYYYHSYYTLPILYQSGANDGFHEAIGDTVALSITPSYLHQLGLSGEVAMNEKNLINSQMKRALDKVAFLPFGKMIDQWRWDVFAGKTQPSSYNAAWWEVRRKFQGVGPPVPRSEQDFDPGAKYHIPANTPYMRYFLAYILQFQFHRALCRIAGFQGPIHECSIYADKQAGARLKAMLAMGSSRPWPDALQAVTGERQMDAGALLEYFAPLQAWLAEQNKGQKCGW